LADVTTYSKRHNEANQEGGRDGHSNNHADNCGIEGPSNDPDITARRKARQRAMLATMFLSQGTPMLLAGDEIGNSQQGNNNAYCQDNETAWLDWAAADSDMTDFVARLSAFRRAHPVLRQTRFLHAGVRAADGNPDVEWCGFQGEPLAWDDPTLSQICMTLRSSAEAPEYIQTDDLVFVVFNRSDKAASVALPATHHGWRVGINSSLDRNDQNAVHTTDITVQGTSVVAMVLAHEMGS
jgi:glycogen operon protein